MARLTQGILGGISGTIGNVVGSSWKGIAIIKSKPLSVSNPKTSGQIAQRAKMSYIVAFARVILAGIIKPLWDRFATQASGYNEFVSQNISLFEAATPSPIADLIISKGQMSAVNPTTINASDGSQSAQVTFITTLPDSYSLTTDEVYVVLINESNGDVSFVSAEDTRADGAAVVTMNEDFSSGDSVHAFLAFRRADGTVVSGTGYKTVTVA
jgi:hypothetical protein